jgi:tetratricopeptide (TPR) repeat protein
MKMRKFLVMALGVLLPCFSPVSVRCQGAQPDSENTLFQRYQFERESRNWLDAKTTLQRLIAMRPGRWDYQQALGDADLNLGQYEQALQSYAAALLVVGSDTGIGSRGDSAGARAALGRMLTSQGDAYLKLKRDTEAIAASTKAAEVSPHPGVAYFNLCATLYNMGNVDGALGACDKAIEADSTKADAYFVKGSVLVGQSVIDAQKRVVAPAGTVEALRKYLELAPDGSHASDVRQMLDYIGATGPTTPGP